MMASAPEQNGKSAARQAPGLADLTLTEQEAHELTEMVEKRPAPPLRTPCDLPEGDASLLQVGSH